jgi:gliding motility-associated-like protein
MKHLALLCILGLFNSASFATHIVGGEINYTQLNKDSFKIELQLYIDCVNGNPGAISQDRFAQIAVFSKKTGLLLPNLSFDVERSTPVRVSKTHYNCIKIGPNACVDAYSYVFYRELPPIEGGYILSFQRCCRNNSILNLVDPESTGANFWTEINPLDSIGGNSSPYFKNLPPNFLCTNTELIFDHAATDADGDSLAYEFFHPFTGANRSVPRPAVTAYETPPFTKITFLTGYDYGNAINSSPNVSINENTGELRLTPTTEGQFVIGIIVKEYRNGVLIGFTQRDYQFNVQNCVFETVSAFAAPDINCDRQVIFSNSSQNATSYFWDFGDSTSTTDTSNKSSGTYTYPKVGNYTVMLVAATGNCADTQFQDITIYERLLFNIPEDTIICKGESIQLWPDRTYPKASVNWSTGAQDTLITVTEPGVYWLHMVLGNCDGVDSMRLSIDDLKVKLSVEDISCNQNLMEYQGNVKVNGNYQTISWSSDPDIMPKNYSDSFFFFNQGATFQINGLNANDCPYTDELNVKDYSGPGKKAKIYNTFTPNNDGYNDVFPERESDYFYTLSVYNRWGRKVFDGENKPWKGKDATNGTFYYTMSVKSCDVEKEVMGVITLIR